MLFFTDEEPPGDMMGGKRHFFGRPSLKGYKQNPFRAGSGGTPGALKEDVILSNPEAVSVLRRLAEIEGGRGELERRFRDSDTQATGVIKKDDFVNAVFELSERQI